MSGFFYARQAAEAQRALAEAAAEANAGTPTIADRTIPVFVATGYDKLFQVLNAALHQAQSGKGKERHAQPDQAFEDQPILCIGNLVGNGFQIGQAIKKAVEAQGMAKRGDYSAATREILGAINYLAAVAIDIERRGHAAEDQRD